MTMRDVGKEVTTATACANRRTVSQAMLEHQMAVIHTLLRHRQAKLPRRIRASTTPSFEAGGDGGLIIRLFTYLGTSNGEIIVNVAQQINAETTVGSFLGHVPWYIRQRRRTSLIRINYVARLDKCVGENLYSLFFASAPKLVVAIYF